MLEKLLFFVYRDAPKRLKSIIDDTVGTIRHILLININNKS